MIKSLQEVLLLQQNINKKLVELADSNSKLLKEVACLPDRSSILNKWWRLCQIIYLMTFQKIPTPLNNEGDAAGPVAKTFLRIASLGMRSVATSYRLKPAM